MAGASLFLSFLPMLPKQVLLTNLMTDFPEMTIATDHVDIEMVAKPRRWDISFVKKFMITFGVLSSIFDYLTFAILIWFLHASQAQFQTGWFMESVISASLIVLVIRSRRPFFKSRPGKYLSIATMIIALVTLVLPYTPLSPLFGFVFLPPYFILLMGLIVFIYILMAELVKKIFIRKLTLRTIFIITNHVY